MSIIKKVRAVEKVFQELEKESVNFYSKSTLTCIENCHSCCTKADMQANPLEFLPLAYHLYQNQQAFAFLVKLEQIQNQQVCVLFNPFNTEGSCSLYKYRGLVCRLFGSSANMDKNEYRTLITCKTIKNQKSGEFKRTQQLINQDLKVPLASRFYMKLYAIDLRLSATYYPVNEAIKNAIETILFHFSLRNKRAS